MKRIIKFLLLIVALLTGYQSMGQSKGQLNAEEISQQRKRYFVPSVSVNVINFTDFATSPLAYIGTGVNGSLGWLWESEKRENHFDINLLTGSTMANTPVSDYFSTYTYSDVIGINFYDHYLFKIFIPSLPEFLNLKIGGALMSTTYYRSNSSLNNNSTGIESILNLMFSAKGTFDISRNKPLTLDLFLFKKTFKPVKRDISFQVNAGLLNLNYRPGYSYLSIAELNGSETSTIDFILNSHSWSINGCRFVTKLEYARYRPSGNGYKWAYIWDAAFVPGKYEDFQIATHRLQYTLVINCK